MHPHLSSQLQTISYHIENSKLNIILTSLLPSTFSNPTLFSPFQEMVSQATHSNQPLSNPLVNCTDSISKACLPLILSISAAVTLMYNPLFSHLDFYSIKWNTPFKVADPVGGHTSLHNWDCKNHTINGIVTCQIGTKFLLWLLTATCSGNKEKNFHRNFLISLVICQVSKDWVGQQLYLKQIALYLTIMHTYLC